MLVNLKNALIQSVRQGLLSWFDFVTGMKTLYIGSEEDPLSDLLKIAGLNIEFAHLEQILDASWKKGKMESFDYVVIGEMLESTQEPVAYLRVLQQILSRNGHLLFSVNNRLGLKYFCGERDPYSGRLFDGLEDYRGGGVLDNGRMYHRGEWEQMLSESGWKKWKFYSVLSDLENPVFLFSDDFQPNENLSIRLMPTYRNPSSVFLDEEFIFPSLCSAGLLPYMANAYLIECTMEGELSDVLHVTSSLERGQKDGLLTVVRGNGTVEKRAAFPEGRKRLQELMEHSKALKMAGVPVVDSWMEQGKYTMSFVEAETAQVYFQKLLRQDKEAFLKEMDRFRDLILSASDCYEGCYVGEKNPEARQKTTLLQKHCYYDMVPHNCFYWHGEFVFYDQEFVLKDYPVNVVLVCMVDSVYNGYADLDEILPRGEVYQRYGLMEEKARWHKLAGDFLSSLRKEKELGMYHSKVRKDPAVVESNRRRMNYSLEEYQRLFVRIFDDVDEKQLFLFGSGAYAKRFISLYGKDCNIRGILDNDHSRHGKMVEGVEIVSPEILHELPPETYKVIVCIKNYLPVLRQLERMGVQHYGVFDPNISYPRREKREIIVSQDASCNKGKKKYHVGYVAGVFDLFHMGHLNMFRRAKEQCDYLIVGVVSDKAVHQNKGENFVPFEERIELVRSCRYVDEAVEIPLHAGGTRDAWHLYHFDVQFSGSDYEHDEYWLREKAFLEQHGATMVFFPYTQSTSSTKLKALIEKRLI